ARERFDQFGNESDSSDNTNKEDKEEKKKKKKRSRERGPDIVLVSKEKYRYKGNINFGLVIGEKSVFHLEEKSKDMEFSNINENSWCDDQFELSVNIK
ncbi:1842_t:CDS:2, partial [Entrophospora sp. SA101]